jgi:hypothetical protein
VRGAHVDGHEVVGKGGDVLFIEVTEVLATED